MSFSEVTSIGPGGIVILPSQVQKPAPPTAEVVPAAAGFMPAFNYSLPRYADREVSRLTPRRAAMMLCDPAVCSSYNTHKMGVVAGGVKLVSPVKQPAWSKRPGAAQSPRGDAGEGGSGVDPAGRSLSPEQTLAKEILDFCERSWNRLRATRGAMLFELLDAMAAGCKMAEVTFAVPDFGPDAGKLVFDRISVKPNWAWRFVVDNKQNVVGFLTYQPNGGYVVYPPEKFVWLSWMPRDSDPRGTSILEAAETAWNLKMQTMPQLYRHNKRFGSPGLDFAMAEGDTSRYPAVNTDGTLKTDGSTMSGGEFYATMLGVYESGGIFVHPAGSVLQIAEPKTNGEAMHMTLDLMDRQIKLAIEYQTRSSLEAKHGSKADSGTAENVKDLVTSFGREWLADGLYPAFKLLVRLNYGDEAAETLTPHPTFGGAENSNRAELWTAAASLGVQVGQSQLEEMDDELGLPIRDAQADADAAAEAMTMQADLAAKAKGSDGPPGADKGKPAKSDKGGK